MLQEILATASYNEQPLQTLFFGGGTPSLIPPRQLDQILQALDRRFGIAAGIALHQAPVSCDSLCTMLYCCQLRRLPRCML